MKKVFEFCDSLSPSFFNYCGYPTIKIHSDYYEVYFYAKSTIRDLDLLKCDFCNEFRMYFDDLKSCIVLVYTFYKD